MLDLKALVQRLKQSFGSLDRDLLIQGAWLAREVVVCGEVNYGSQTISVFSSNLVETSLNAFRGANVNLNALCGIWWVGSTRTVKSDDMILLRESINCR